MKLNWLAAFFLSIPAVAGPIDEARALYERGQFGEGDHIVSEWLEANPNDENVVAAFQLLDREGAISSRGWPDTLVKWADESNLRGDYARFYDGIVKRVAGDFEGAIEDFTALFKKGVLVEPTRVQLVETHLAAGQFEEAEKEIEIIEDLLPDKSVLAYLRGLKVRYWLKAGEPGRAIALFRGMDPAEFTDTDIFHSGLSALHAMDEPWLAWARKALEERGLESLLGELAFEEGLLLADASDSAAFEILAAFLRNFPDHPRAADAEIALAEQHLNQVPAQPQAARDRQASARRRALTLSQSERLDYSAIWTERIAGDLPTVIERGARFLNQWPLSNRRPEVIMMLGRACYEQGNYPEAIDHFEQLSAMSDQSELAEIALFFAAKAASLTLTYENHEKALTLWDVVAERGGPLASSALHEQGLLHVANNRLDEGLLAFEKVLKGDYETSDDLKVATLCDSGHALFLKALASHGDELLLRSAMESFQAAENYPGATKAWKYQAKVRRAKCLEALGNHDDALGLYFSIVRDSSAPSDINATATIPIEQFDWLYRAGFSAIKLLEGQENWKGAVELAEVLAETGGSRAIEASERANRIRLEQFVWEGDD